MDKEDVVYTHIHICIYTTEYYAPIQKTRNLAICNKVAGTRGYYVKQNKSIRERQLSHDLTDMRNLRNKTEDHRGREGKMKNKMKPERETNHKRILNSGNKLRVAREERGGRDGVTG